MKKLFQLVEVAVVMVTAVVMTGCIKEGGKENGELKVGDSLPDFEVVMNDGSIVSDESLKGSVSVVMFFHTGCPDCQQVLPDMQEIQDEYGLKGVKFAPVSREEGSDVIESYWKEKGLKMAYSPQNDRAVYEKFAQTRIPRIYINDKDGIIRYIYTDDPVPGYYDLKSAVESLLD